PARRTRRKGPVRHPHPAARHDGGDDVTTYDIGDAVVITTRIGVDGTPVDPVGVSLDLTSPDGTTSTPAVQHISTGVYEVAFTASQPGRWLFKWTASTPDSVEHGQDRKSTRLNSSHVK